MTVLELIEAGEQRLTAARVAFGHGTDNAFDEAVWLVLWRLGLPLHDLDSVADRAVTAGQQSEVTALFSARIETRQPAAYLTGEAWLQGVAFHADPRAIVPRSFIAELLVDGSLDPWLDRRPSDEAPRPLRVLDLCTGNGSLAVLAAMAWPDALVTGTDISASALEVARINVDRHELQGRVRLVQSDGLRSVPDRYDLILCNPPYVITQSMAQLPAEYRAEPALALAGGADGMELIRGLLQQAPACMCDAAVLVLEIGNERANFEAAFPTLEAIWLETSAGLDQVLLATRDALVQAHRS